MPARQKIKKVVLAYSGGLDTSIILKWLQQTYGCEVVTFTADLGQEGEIEPARSSGGVGARGPVVEVDPQLAGLHRHAGPAAQVGHQHPGVVADLRRVDVLVGGSAGPCECGAVQAALVGERRLPHPRRANVVAQQAVANRLAQLTGFEQIIAPFDGVVTARETDVGLEVFAFGSLVAVDDLTLAIPKGTRVFVDNRYFQGYDDGYAIAAIRAPHGSRIVRQPAAP